MADDTEQLDAPSPYAKPGPYVTKLSPAEEVQFQQWVHQDRIPWEDNPHANYDMRGYWKAQQAGDPLAARAKNKHFPDKWKTPYHKYFSNESMYATPDAPHWEGNQLVPTKMANGTQERETVDIKLGNDVWPISVPKGMSDKDAITHAMGVSSEFADAYRNYKLFKGAKAPGVPKEGLPSSGAAETIANIIPEEEATERVRGTARNVKANPSQLNPSYSEATGTSKEIGDKNFPTPPERGAAQNIEYRLNKYNPGGQMVVAAQTPLGLKTGINLIRNPKSIVEFGTKAAISYGVGEAASHGARKIGVPDTVADLIGIVAGTAAFGTSKAEITEAWTNGGYKAVLSALAKKVPFYGRSLAEAEQKEAQLKAAEKIAADTAASQKKIDEAHKLFEKKIDEMYEARIKEISDRAKMAKIEATEQAKAGKALPVTVGPGGYRGPKSVPPSSESVSKAPGGYTGPESVPKPSKPTPPPKPEAPESGDIMKGPTAPQHKAVRAGQAKVAGQAERRVVPIGESPEPQPEEETEGQAESAPAREAVTGTSESPVTPSSQAPSQGTPEPYTTKEAMGIKWAVTPGLPDISISPRLSEAEIPAYVAKMQALQRQGMRELPKAETTAPKAKGAKVLEGAPVPRKGPYRGRLQYHSMSKAELKAHADAGDLNALDQLEAYGRRPDLRQRLLQRYPGGPGSKVQ